MFVRSQEIEIETTGWMVLHSRLDENQTRYLKENRMESTTHDLAQMECEPCKGGVPPMKGGELQEMLKRLGNGWQVVEEHHLHKQFDFKNFRQALDFTNRVGELAEAQGHHPDIHLSWGKAVIDIWTHKIDGLTESDFILAAKIEEQAAPGDGRP